MLPAARPATQCGWRCLAELSGREPRSSKQHVAVAIPAEGWRPPVPAAATRLQRETRDLLIRKRCALHDR